jgi:hypothetical protein
MKLKKQYPVKKRTKKDLDELPNSRSESCTSLSLITFFSKIIFIYLYSNKNRHSQIMQQSNIGTFVQYCDNSIEHKSKQVMKINSKSIKY